MPELPDVVVYLEALRRRVQGRRLEGVRLAFGMEGDLWLVLHLMIAGRLHWKPPGAKMGGKQTLAAFDFEAGRLLLTEAGSKKRASLHVVEGEAGLRGLNPGGLEVLEASLEEFAASLRAENHTLKRSLTDPRVFSGIGNAYSDEILHRAQLSPVALSQKLTAEEVGRLYEATQQTLTEWVEKVRDEAGAGFPEKVTAFREGMAVHGRYGKLCPVCGTRIQRIRYAENETNYCPGCQTGGRLLADRGLSRLLREDWPRTLDEMELRLGR
jgi:formamidopyrimidine-DNA glycosylase